MRIFCWCCEVMHWLSLVSIMICENVFYVLDKHLHTMLYVNYVFIIRKLYIIYIFLLLPSLSSYCIIIIIIIIIVVVVVIIMLFMQW